MNRRRTRLVSLIAAMAALWLESTSVLACAVCYGKSESALAEGMNFGILTLLVFVVLMWAGVAGFVFHLARRSKNAAAKREQTTPEEASLTH